MRRSPSLVLLLLSCLTLVCPVSRAAATEPPQIEKGVQDMILIEAESMTDADGIPILGPRGVMRSSNVFFNANAKASAGGFITPVSMPYRIYTPFAKPVEALIDVEIPKAGRWYAHVRYLVTPDGQRKLAERVKHYHPFGPFDVVLEGHSFVCGTNQEPGAEFRWDVLAVDLQAGRIPLKLRMTDLAGPDCIILTRTPGYQPELCDCTGPLWLRFKVLEGTRVPFYIHCRCVFSSYESKKPLEPGTLFKGVVATTDEDIVKLRGDPKALLNAGEWSPWIKTFEGKKADWYTHAEFMSVASKPDAATRRHGVDQIKVAWQAATRADEAFLVREGIEDSGAGRGIHILMPHSRGGEGLRRGTMGFTEWADERLGLVTNLGVRAGEGPRKIRVYTSINATVPRDLDASLESCRLLGFNGVDCAQQGLVDPASLWARIQVNGFTWTAAHHLSPAYEVKWFDAPTNAPAGKTLLQAMDQYLYDKSAERIHRLWDGRPEVQRQMLELAILVDEPGPVPNVLILNNSPALKACFHEYLRDNGLAPADFGKTNWCEVEAMGYIARHTKTLDGMLQALGVEVDWIEEGHTRVAAPATPRTPGTPLGHRIQVALSAGPHAATPGQKRLYYWTQRFRSMFTHRFYGAGAQVIRDLSAQGWLRPSIQASPNFQASPIMEAQMGDGGLNLFEWARSGATDCLLMEDWVGDPYRVAFGFSLVDAAARKHGQSLAYLIVVDRRFRTRYLSGLALGARRFVDFTYGPLLKAGPPWGDNREYVKNWGEMLRWTRQVEDDLVQTKARPAQTAILIANSSEINTAFYNALGAEAGVKRGYGGRPLFRRAGVYAALLDAGIPVDLVSEEEIFEDKALDRYKALYVVDTHVAAPVQEAIKAWVKAGGTLWADYTALARDQYDQPSAVMNEVFGLAQRGSIPGPVVSSVPDEEVLQVTSGSVDGARGAALAAASSTPGTVGEVIHIASDGSTGSLEDVTFEGSLFRPSWKLSSGEALAAFTNGQPALVRNRYGLGWAMLLGCSVLALSPYGQQSDTHAEFAKVRRVVALGADLAGSTRHCRLSVPRVAAFVRDGASQTVLFLINETAVAQPGVSVKLTTPQSVKSAYDARGKPVTFRQANGEVTFFRDLGADDGDIVVFKW